MNQPANHHAPLDFSEPLIVGFGITGRAVAAALVAHDIVAQVADDRPGDAANEAAATLGISLHASPDPAALQTLAEAASVILPSPGIPDHHPIFAAAEKASTPIASEFDLAAVWDSRPLVAITGTNGKTSVTMMVTDALNRSGRRAEAVGNTEIPLVQAIADPSIDCFVVEASSFRLAHSARFAPSVAAWLNFAPDHLDAHATLDDYRMAKASVFANLGSDGIAVVNSDDPVVAEAGAQLSGSEVRRFGLASSAEWTVQGDHLVGPAGPIVDVSDLARRQPHDLANALAAAAIADAAGATGDGIAEMLRTFTGLPHRVEFVGEGDGIAWFNDSKATVPHATLAALGGFDSVVLIAGGRNKGLDLSSLASGVPPVKAVVATGDAASEIAAVFGDAVPIEMADDMASAIRLAANVAEAGDTVLLSPACTSYDWYSSYVARGDDFTKLVQEHLA